MRDDVTCKVTAWKQELPLGNSVQKWRTETLLNKNKQDLTSAMKQMSVNSDILEHYILSWENVFICLSQL